MCVHHSSLMQIDVLTFQQVFYLHGFHELGTFILSFNFYESEIKILVGVDDGVLHSALPIGLEPSKSSERTEVVGVCRVAAVCSVRLSSASGDSNTVRS
jgi:hypothetical protein